MAQMQRAAGSSDVFANVDFDAMKDRVDSRLTRSKLINRLGMFTPGTEILLLRYSLVSSLNYH